MHSPHALCVLGRYEVTGDGPAMRPPGVYPLDIPLDGEHEKKASRAKAIDFMTWIHDTLMYVAV